MADIDHFKRFNDTFGHDAGDLILKHVGEMLRRLLRQGDVACRFGGEELILLLPGISIAEALAAAERIRAGAQLIDVVHRGQSVGKITMSIGVAEFPSSGDTPEAIIAAADQASYAAKHGGRNRVERISATALPGAEPARTSLARQ